MQLRRPAMRRRRRRRRRLREDALHLDELEMLRARLVEECGGRLDGVMGEGQRRSLGRHFVRERNLLDVLDVLDAHVEWNMLNMLHRSMKEGERLGDRLGVVDVMDWDLGDDDLFHHRLDGDLDNLLDGDLLHHDLLHDLLDLYDLLHLDKFFDWNFPIDVNGRFNC